MALRSPQDARVAVLSFPRRFDELFVEAEGRDDVRPPELAFIAEQQRVAARALSDASVALGGVGSEILSAAADELAAVIERRAAEDWQDDIAGISALGRVDAAVTAGAAALRQAEARVRRDD